MIELLSTSGMIRPESESKVLITADAGTVPLEEDVLVLEDWAITGAFDNDNATVKNKEKKFFIILLSALLVLSARLQLF